MIFAAVSLSKFALLAQALLFNRSFLRTCPHLLQFGDGEEGYEVFQAKGHEGSAKGYEDYKGHEGHEINQVSQGRPKGAGQQD